MANNDRYECKIFSQMIQGAMNNNSTAANTTSYMINTVEVYDTFNNTHMPTPEGVDPVEYCRELNAKAHDRALYLKQINSYIK